MEIHPPGHIQSFRDVAIHLAIVTAGILIALGLEQTVEFFNHRRLVAEARANILSEIRDNKQELDKQVALLGRFRSAAVEALDFITDIQETGKSNVHTLHLNMYNAQLHDANWSTAQAVGALALMPYSDVNTYAAAYHRQSDYLSTQSRTEEAGVSAYSVFSARNRFEKLSHSELEAERAKLMVMVSCLTLQIDEARSLDRSYENVLAGKSAPSAGEHAGEGAPKP